MPIPKLSFRASIVDKLLAEISFPLKRASANLFRSRGVDTIPPAPSGIEGWVTDSILHLSKYLYELHSFCSGEIKVGWSDRRGFQHTVFYRAIRGYTIIIQSWNCYIALYCLVRNRCLHGRLFLPSVPLSSPGYSSSGIVHPPWSCVSRCDGLADDRSLFYVRF